jgi:DNA-directed RNA polymerase specialized sigma24 family protein
MKHERAITRINTKRDAFQRVVVHAFNLLPIFRKVFLLCDIQGLSAADAADILGISPVAVSRRLDRARREMMLRLGARPERKNVIH